VERFHPRVSGGRDPGTTLKRAQAMRRLLDAKQRF